MNSKDIAIIGMACKFSDADHPQEFWERLRAGQELIHICDAEEIGRSALPASLAGDASYIKTRSLIRDKDAFDAPFFGYTADEAALMDPQMRLFHEYVWKALEDAGYDPFAYDGKIGIFAGASENLNWMAHWLMKGPVEAIDPFWADKIVNRSYLSTLLAYKLNLRGPAYFVDTACSTSLAAVHLACRNLLMNECSLAIAGAVRIGSSTVFGYQYAEGMIGSRDGHCRTFDADASGTMPGEGLGIVILKKLRDALQDGDQVYAVIRGSAANNDGNRKVGYTAPAVTGQAECIMLAQRLADIQPCTVSYVEAHGTATKLGDPVEIEALNRAFGYDKEKYCAVGSVKSNLGHLDTAAGIAGLIKTALSLRNKTLPASLHFHAVNPEIPFENGPFYVNDRLSKWDPQKGGIRRAGVSSFGIGGTNVHIVLEEAPDQPAETMAGRVQLMICSARTATALERQVAALTSYVGATTAVAADIAYTLQERRRHFPHRAAFLCSPDGRLLAGGKAIRGKTVAGRRGPIVFLFPGQGSQYIRMGQGLYEWSASFRATMDEGFDRLKQLSNEDHRAIWLGARGDIHHTRNAQPLLFLLEYALGRWLIGAGIKPDVMVGHSLGELSAACIADAISFEDGLEIVLKRAELMGRAPEGIMLGVDCPEERIRPLLDENSSVTAVNTFLSCVAGGPRENMERLAGLLQEQQIPVRRLKTSHAFHSPMMAPLAAAFGWEISGYSFGTPKIPIVSTVSADYLGDEELSADYLVRQLRHPVRFAESVKGLLPEDRGTFLEIGPGTTLSGFCRQMAGNNGNGQLFLNLLRHHREDQDDHALLLDRLGRVWASGIDIDWGTFRQGEKRTVVPLPGYSFDKHRFTAEVDPLTASAVVSPPTASSPVSPSTRDMPEKKRPGEWFYVPGWRRCPLSEAGQQPPLRTILLFSTEDAVALRVRALLENDGHLLLTVRTGDDLIAIAGALRQQQAQPDQVVYLWPLSGEAAGDGPDRHARELFLRFLEVYKAFAFHEREDAVTVLLVSRSLQEVTGAERKKDGTGIADAALLKAWSQEGHAAFCCHVDIGEEGDPGVVAESIYAELSYNRQDNEVAWRAGFRWVRSYEPLLIRRGPASLLRRGGTYLLTGGGGKLGTCIAEYLLRNYGANVVLLGRRLPAGGILPDHWREWEKQVCYEVADVADREELEAAIDRSERIFGRIHGVIHAAGNSDRENFRLLESTTASQVAAHFAPKVAGALHLGRIFAGRKPDFIWLASSLSVVVGGVGYGAYLAANTVMNNCVPSDGETKWICACLDGLALTAGMDRTLGITEEELGELFEMSLQAARHRQLVISVSDLRERLAANNRVKKEQGNDAPLREREGTGVDYCAPETEEERQLGILWEEVLGIANIGVLDNFLELGGDSLKAMALSRKIHRHFDVELSADFFFRNTTIRSYAREIEIVRKLRTISRQQIAQDQAIII